MSSANGGTWFSETIGHILNLITYSESRSLRTVACEPHRVRDAVVMQYIERPMAPAQEPDQDGLAWHRR
jgi:hypothetical protein